MNQVRGLVIIIGGLVLVVLGIGMWQSPEINWEGFLAAWYTVGKELVRLKSDPFAILGIIVIVAGVLIAYNGLKRLVRG